MRPELRLLGTLDVRLVDVAASDRAMRHPKRIALLAYLAVARPRGFHRRDALIAMFWPELATDAARGALRTALTRLRKEFGAGAITSRADEIRLETDAIWCDTTALEEAVGAGRANEIGDLYRGDLLAALHVEGIGEEFESWLSAERVRIRDSAVQVLSAHVRSLESRGDRRAAVPIAQRAFEIAPHDETVSRQLIRLLAAAGDHGKAAQVYQVMARRLSLEFETSPSRETLELMQSLRATSREYEAAAPLVDSPSARFATEGSLPLAVRANTQSGGPHHAARRAFLKPALAGVALILVALSVGAKLLYPGRPPAARWISLPAPIESRPPSRDFESAFLDSTANALVVFGGLTSRGEGSDSSPILGDMWRLTGLRRDEAHHWQRVQPAAGPSPGRRWNSLATYDAATDRALIHGGAMGHSSPCANDTWVLDHASGIGATPRWRAPDITGTLPPPHAETNGFYDGRTRSLVVLGGNDCVATFTNDVWVLSFDASSLRSGVWHRLSPTGFDGSPVRRNAAAAAYDPKFRRLWLEGGHDRNPLSDLWRLDDPDGSAGRPAWHRVHCGGEAPALYGHLAAYDTTSGALLLFGGIDENGEARNDVWVARNLNDDGHDCRWERLGAAEHSPLPRDTPRGFVLPSGDALIVVGGSVENVAFLDLWRLDHPLHR